MYNVNYLNKIATFTETSDAAEKASLESLVQIDEHELGILFGQMKNVHDLDGELRYTKPCLPRTETFAYVDEYEDMEVNLEPVCTILTFHTSGHRLLFKPTFAEVAAALDPEVIKKEGIVAFSTEHQRSTIYRNGDLAQTTLYRKKVEKTA